MKVNKKRKNNYKKDLKKEFKTGQIHYKHFVKKKEMLNSKDLKQMKKKEEEQISKKIFYTNKKENNNYKKLIIKYMNKMIRSKHFNKNYFYLMLYKRWKNKKS